ncbi:hypothetical protein N9Z25_08585 [Luminiphilus sp.]|nr:hypothetical protein [Luminiphilus sp.]
MSAMQRTVKKHWRCQAMVLLACLLPQSDALSGSTVLAPKTNTGLQNIQLKEVQCNDQGLWSVDIVNNAFAGAHVEYFFWLEDSDADAIQSDAGQVRLAPKSRGTVELVFSCELPFTELRQHFQWAPTGFTRQ